MGPPCPSLSCIQSVSPFTRPHPCHVANQCFVGFFFFFGACFFVLRYQSTLGKLTLSSHSLKRTFQDPTRVAWAHHQFICPDPTPDTMMFWTRSSDDFPLALGRICTSLPGGQVLSHCVLHTAGEWISVSVTSSRGLLLSWSHL